MNRYAFYRFYAFAVRNGISDPPSAALANWVMYVGVPLMFLLKLIERLKPQWMPDLAVAHPRATIILLGVMLVVVGYMRWVASGEHAKLASIYESESSSVQTLRRRLFWCWFLMTPLLIAALIFLGRQ